MHVEFKKWLEDPECSIPDDQQLISEIGAIPVERETSNNIKYLEAKEDIKKELGWSPNKLDAIVLTFAYPVRSRIQDEMTHRQNRPPEPKRWHTQLKTLKGVR
jgi:hypothetical protein